MAMFVAGCQNRTENNIETMIEYNTEDSLLYLKIPNTLELIKKDKQSLLFQGDEKAVMIAITDMSNKWDKDLFVDQFISSNQSELNIVEQNDSITAYEIKKGAFSIPAQIVSVHERNDYSVLVATIGIDLQSHKAIGQSIRCIMKDDHIWTKSYNGEYISLSYPSTWIVDETPNTFTSDVYISQSDHAFGVWLYRFELENNMTFNNLMNDLVGTWRDIASVDISYEQINGIEWCRHDIQILDADIMGRQISYYCQRGNYIYNVKFGNNIEDVKKNLTIIDSVMHSIIINN